MSPDLRIRGQLVEQVTAVSTTSTFRRSLAADIAGLAKDTALGHKQQRSRVVIYK